MPYCSCVTADIKKMIITYITGTLKNIRAGDCIVCFSKNDIYSVTTKLESLGFETAVIYGGLPPGESGYCLMQGKGRTGQGRAVRQSGISNCCHMVACFRMSLGELGFFDQVRYKLGFTATEDDQRLEILD